MGLTAGVDIEPLLNFLLESYRHAAAMVDAQGIETWPKQIVHADWHPGNMLFRENRVVAVIDYDSARCCRASSTQQTVAFSSASLVAMKTFPNGPITWMKADLNDFFEAMMK